METRRLPELRNDRMEKLKQAKREALAKRKQSAKPLPSQEPAEAEV
jgi:hypothetical protein